MLGAGCRNVAVADHSVARYIIRRHQALHHRSGVIGWPRDGATSLREEARRRLRLRPPDFARAVERSSDGRCRSWRPGPPRAWISRRPREGPLRRSWRCSGGTEECRARLIALLAGKLLPGAEPAIRPRNVAPIRRRCRPLRCHRSRRPKSPGEEGSGQSVLRRRAPSRPSSRVQAAA